MVWYRRQCASSSTMFIPRCTVRISSTIEKSLSDICAIFSSGWRRWASARAARTTAKTLLATRATAKVKTAELRECPRAASSLWRSALDAREQRFDRPATPVQVGDLLAFADVRREVCRGSPLSVSPSRVRACPGEHDPAHHPLVFAPTAGSTVCFEQLRAGCFGRPRRSSVPCETIGNFACCRTTKKPSARRHAEQETERAKFRPRCTRPSAEPRRARAPADCALRVASLASDHLP